MGDARTQVFLAARGGFFLLFLGLLRPHQASGCPRLGYPLPRAIVALQKMGQQSLSQFLSCLSTRDQLLWQATRRAQRRRLWRCSSSLRASQGSSCASGKFSNMDFQQDRVKEMLLVRANCCQQALEELVACSQ